ncbi:MAG: cupin domain-containing protein [Rhizobiaceae bacterium]
MVNDTYLISREEIDGLEGERKVHFLNPDAIRVNKSLGNLTGITGFGFHIIEVAPGDETTEYHVHHFEDECVYVLAGTATAEIGDQSFGIKAGDFIGYRKGGLPHTITNTGIETLRCIVVGERLAHDVGDYPRKHKRIYRNAGMDWELVSHDAIESPAGSTKK